MWYFELVFKMTLLSYAHIKDNSRALCEMIRSQEKQEIMTMIASINLWLNHTQIYARLNVAWQ